MDENVSKSKIPPYVGSAQFAALEPSWAGVHDENQLRGLLILGSLFNKTLHIHDTQIADNPHLLRSYQQRNDNENNLFNSIILLIENNVVRVGIRDETYIASRDESYSCGNLFDVYSSWVSQGKENAWVIPPETKNRLELLKDFDSLLSTVNLLQYPYVDIKKDFMRLTRQENKTKNSIFYKEFEKLPTKIRERYGNIINREWFSHSDIYELLKESNLTIQDPFIQAHGLFDESAYANWNKSRLLGCDSSKFHAEDIVLGLKENEGLSYKKYLLHNSLQKHAFSTIEANGLNLISTISPAEIILIREEASDLFRLVEFMRDTKSLDTILELRDNYIEEVKNYWDYICKYLRKTRPSLTQRRTEIGIFTRDKLPNFSAWGQKYMTFAINLAPDFINKPLLSKLNNQEFQNLLNESFFRFIFFTDTSAMSQLKDIFPNRTWLSKYHTTLQ